MAIVGFNPNRFVSQSPQSNANNINGNGNVVTNTNNIDQSVTNQNRTFNGGDTNNIYLNFHEAPQQAPQQCEKGKGKGKGKGRGKAKGKKGKHALQSPQQAQAANSPQGMMLQAMKMMISMMSQMQSGGFAGGGIPGVSINSGMSQFAHPGFMI